MLNNPNMNWDAMTASELKESYPTASNEALDMFLRDVKMQIEHHTYTQSQFGISMMYPQALLDDANFTAIAYLKEYYEGGFGQGQQQGMIDDMLGEVSVRYEEEAYRVVPAANLPAGWSWQEFDDGSGGLQSPDNKTVVSYDLSTSEYQYKGKWSFMSGYPEDPVSFADFKDSMEKRVRIDLGIDDNALSAEIASPNLHTPTIEPTMSTFDDTLNKAIKSAQKDLETMDKLPALFDEAVKDYIAAFKNDNPAFQDVQIPFFHPPMPDYFPDVEHKGKKIEAECIDHQTVQATQFCLMKDPTDANSPFFAVSYRIDKIDDVAGYAVQNLKTKSLAEARRMFGDVVAGREPKVMSVHDKLAKAVTNAMNNNKHHKPNMQSKQHTI